MKKKHSDDEPQNLIVTEHLSAHETPLKDTPEVESETTVKNNTDVKDDNTEVKENTELLPEKVIEETSEERSDGIPDNEMSDNESVETSDEDDHANNDEMKEDEKKNGTPLTTLDPKQTLTALHLTDPEVVKALREALGIEKEIEEARAAGELAGRNSRIEELMATLPRPGDGLPFHGGESAGSGHRPRSIFDLAGEARF